MSQSPAQDRTARQRIVAGIGEDGQARIGASRALVVGLGALGAASADILARAGIGGLRIVDRDILELSNLQRQVLYSEADLDAGLPKAEAARRRLAEVNRDCDIEARVCDVTPETLPPLLDGIDLIVDGTDNFETRLLINDAALSRGIPWVYCGVIGASVHSLPILPADGPCLRCYIGDAPPPGSIDTCDTAGVLGPAVLVAVGLATLEALKLLAGRREAVIRELQVADLWSRECRRVRVRPDPSCPACAGDYAWLKGGAGRVARLCGRDAVQLPPAGALDLGQLRARLEGLGELSGNPFLLRFRPREWPGVELTLFPDGRVIVKGTQDTGRARSLAARYLGG